MLLRNLFVKSLLDHRRGLAWWVLGVVLLSAAMTSFYPSISTNDAIQDYVDAFDPDLLALFGFTELMDITSGPGYLNAEIFSFMVPVLVIIFAVSLGASAIAGEEDKRTMEILLSEPVSRRRVVLEKYAFLLAANAMLGVVVWLSLAVGVIIFDMEVSMFKLAGTTLSSALLGGTFGSLAFAVGAVTGNRGLSLGVSAGAAAATYVINTLASIVDVLEPAKWLSPFFYYNGNVPIANGLDPLHVSLLLVVIAVPAIAGYIAFQRRDLRL